MAERTIDGHAVSYPLDPTRWWPHAGVLDNKEDETGGRWACHDCHLSLLYSTERASDVINVLQVHGYNVQYLGKGPGPDTTNACAPRWWKACYRVSGLALAINGV